MAKHTAMGGMGKAWRNLLSSDSIQIFPGAFRLPVHIGASKLAITFVERLDGSEMSESFGVHTSPRKVIWLLAFDIDFICANIPNCSFD